MSQDVTRPADAVAAENTKTTVATATSDIKLATTTITPKGGGVTAPRWRFNDGGRSEAGLHGETGDCICRAVAIATGKRYAEVYDELTALGWNCWEPWNRSYDTNEDYWLKHSFFYDPDDDICLLEEECRQEIFWRDPNDGSAISDEEARRREDSYLKSLGGQWTAMREVHLRADELPAGRLIVEIPGHLVAVIDGVIHDTFDCSRGGTLCIYGWWSVPRR